MTLTRKILTATAAAVVLTGIALASSSDVLAKGKGGGGGGMGGGMGGRHGAHGHHGHNHHGHHGHRHGHRHRHHYSSFYVTGYDSCWKWTGYRWINVCVVPY